MKTYAKIAAALIAGFVLSSTTVFGQTVVLNKKSTKKILPGIKKRLTFAGANKFQKKTFKTSPLNLKPPGFQIKPKVVKPKVQIPKILTSPAVGGGPAKMFLVQPTPQQPPISLGFTALMCPQGLRIVSVTCGSHAENIGLETGDIITRIDGRRFYSIGQFRSILSHVIADHQGRLKLRIRNIRHDFDPWQPKYVNRVYFLPVWGQPVGPGFPIPVGF